MRLLHTKELEVGGFELKEFGEQNMPRYAILSHTWGEEEVTFQDMTLGRFANKKGYDKIRRCCSLARTNGYDYVWVDTCCIDKTSSAELSEAINSMYRWYGDAEVCYGFLADVPSMVGFSESRWFTRGWTLQELIAPEMMIFLDEAWKELGTRESLKQEISDCTGIPVEVLSGHGLEVASIAQKMSWAAQRQTSRSEDRAYCLMGLFGINMPLLYGEGERAFIRLQEEIMKVSDDDSIFAWKSEEQNHGSLLATSPDAFGQAANIVLARTPLGTNKPLMVSNKGINLELSYMGVGHQGLGLAILQCAERGREALLIAIYLRDISLTMENFERVWCEKFELINLTRLRSFQYPSRWINVRQHRPVTVRTRNRNQDQIAQPRVNPLLSLDETFIPDPTSGLFDRAIDFVTGLSTTPPINWDNNEEPPSLLQMAEEGRVKEVQWLLAQPNTRPDQKDEDGRTPLSYAAAKGHAKVVWIFLARRDVKPDEKDAEGRTPLSHAAGGGHIEVVWLLLTRSDIDIHSRDHGGLTPLFHAAANGQDRAINMILARGDAQNHVKDNDGRTPLFYASAGGHEGAVKTFLARSDMEADTRDTGGVAPLCMAARNGHAAIAQILIEQGADIDTRDKDGQTALWWAAQNGHSAVTRLLLDKGASTENKASRDGCPPLLVAAHRGHDSILRQLLDKGADIEATDNYGQTALLIATTDGHETTARILVDKGAAIDARNKQDQTPLWWASYKGHIGIMRLLLDKGADVDAMSQRGETPLSWVAKYGQDEAVAELLLERGANPEVNAEAGQTPLYWAKLGERTSLVQLLEKYSPHGGQSGKEKASALSKTRQLLRSLKS
ncbi:ankyrin repeat-containing domain protein [Trichoderma ceciliae]